MFRAINLVRVTPTFMLPFIEDRNKSDKLILAKSPNPPDNGLERLKRMYSRNEYDESSVELTNVVQSALTGTFVGACMGGFVRSREAYLYFIENNQATIFKTTLQAKKKLQDYVTLAFAKGAMFWGWRLGIFTGMFGLISTSISVYRGETSVLEYSIAGVVTGGIYRANLGLAAFLVGAGLGGVLSTIAGTFIVLLLKISGLTMDDIRKSLYSLKEARDEQSRQLEEKCATIKNDELTKHHDHLVTTKGVKTLEQI